MLKANAHSQTPTKFHSFFELNIWKENKETIETQINRTESLSEIQQTYKNREFKTVTQECNGTPIYVLTSQLGVVGMLKWLPNRFISIFDIHIIKILQPQIYRMIAKQILQQWLQREA